MNLQDRINLVIGLAALAAVVFLFWFFDVHLLEMLI